MTAEPDENLWEAMVTWDHDARMVARGGRPRRPSRLLAAVLSLVLLAGAAACSDSDPDEGAEDDTTEEGTEPASRTSRGVTDDTVKVGGMIYSQFFAGADVGVRARLERANAEGGVHGRQVEFVGIEDTNNEQANALAIGERLVQQEEVFALLPVASSNLGIVDFAEQEKVPYFGYGSDPAFCGNDWAFGITGCVSDPNFRTGSNASGVAMREYFDGDTDKTIALIGEDNDAALGGIRLLAASLEAGGFEVVYMQNPVPAPPTPVGDFSPFVADLLSADDGEAPDVIYAVLTGASAIGFVGAVNAAGYEGLTVIPSYDPRIAGAVEGSGIITQFAPYEMADEIPALQQMIDDVREVDPEQLLTVGLAAGYWAADMFLALLEETGEDLTVESFLAASDGWSYEAPGVVGESTWPENHDRPVPCAAFSIARDGGFEPAVPLTCGENIEIDG